MDDETTCQTHVIIIGAGPSGCLLAILLAKQGARVTIYDSRVDTRTESTTTNDQRSINLALSTRGLTALSRAGLAERVKCEGIPMHARCIHSTDVNDPTTLHEYGQPGQHLLSVSRSRLTHVLQSAAENYSQVSLKFSHKCISVDLDRPSVTLKNIQPNICDNENIEFTEYPTFIVGADGTFSRVRAAMARKPGFNFSQEYIPCLYKELSFIVPSNIQSDDAQKNKYYPNALHIWPRHEFMLIALPNHDIDESGAQFGNSEAKTQTNSVEDDVDTSTEINNGSKVNDTDNTTNLGKRIKSFTATLFMPSDLFSKLDSDEKIVQFMTENFPDALPAMPQLTNDFRNNPTSPLLTIRCKPYNVSGRAVLIGDAAHAIVPFYGQGCNAAMEDSVLLSDMISQYGWNNLDSALSSYSKMRKQDADAIADLAIDHYHDMSSRSVSSFHILKRKVEITLNRIFPSSFLPLYSLVSFSTVPYSKAVQRAETQDKQIVKGIFIASTFAAFSAAAVIFLASSGRRFRFA